MNEQVIQDLYNRAVSKGYKKSQGEFVQLLYTNGDVFNDMFSYVQSKGYSKSSSDFEVLIGKKKDEAVPSAEETTPSPQQQPAAMASPSGVSSSASASGIQEFKGFSPEQLSGLQASAQEAPEVARVMADLPEIEKERRYKGLETQYQKGEEDKKASASFKAATTSEADFASSLEKVNKELIDFDEDYIAPQLNYMFGNYGFTFNQAKPGQEAIEVVAPNGKTKVIAVDTFSNKKDLESSNELKAFINENKPKIISMANQYSQYEKKFNNEQEIANSFKSINEEANALAREQKDVAARYAAVQKEMEYLSTPAAKASPDYQQRLAKFNSDSQEINNSVKQLSTKESDVILKQKKLEKSVGMYTEMKSEQGGIFGAMYNSAIGNIGTSASGKLNLFTDFISAVIPWEYQMGDDAYQKSFIEKAISSGISVPSTLNKENFNAWIDKLDEDIKDDIDSKILNENRKIVKNEMLPVVRTGLVQMIGDKGTTKEYIEKKQEDYIAGGLIGLAGSAPAIVLSLNNSPVGMSEFFFLGMDATMQQMNAPEFKDVSETEKYAVAVPVGIVNAVLEEFGLRNVIGKSGVVNNLVIRALNKSSKTTKAKTFKELVENEIENDIARGVLTFAAAGLAEAETGAAQAAAEVGIQEIYNEVKGKKLFQTPNSMGEFVDDVLKAGIQEAVGGFVMGMPSAISTAYKENNYNGVTDEHVAAFQAFANDENVRNAFGIKLKNDINSGKITPEQAKEKLENYTAAAGLLNSLPDNLDNSQKRKALGLVQEIKKLENEILNKDEALTKKQRTRIAEINTELEAIAEMTPSAAAPTAPAAEVKPITAEQITDPDAKSEIDERISHYEEMLAFDEKRYDEKKAEWDKKGIFAKMFGVLAGTKPSYNEAVGYAKKKLDMLRNNPEAFFQEEVKSKSEYIEQLQQLRESRKDITDDDIDFAKRRKEYLDNVLQKIKEEQDAIQKQAAGQVPVQPRAGGRQEVAQGEPQAGPQEVTQAGQAQEEVVSSRTLEEQVSALEQMMTEEDTNDLIDEFGVAVDTVDDAKASVSRGDLVYVIDETTGTPNLVSDVTMLDGYAADQIVVVPRENSPVAQKAKQVSDTDFIMNPITPTDNVIVGSNKAQLDSVRAQTTDATKRRVLDMVDSGVKVLKALFPKMDIAVHTTKESYDEAMRAIGMDTNSKGQFSYLSDSKGNVVGGRIDIDLSSADGVTVAHEIAHAVMLKAFGDNPTLFKGFRDRISKILADSTVKQLNDFADQYSESESHEEFLVELAGLLTEQEKNLTPTLVQQIANIINDIVSTITNGAFVPFKGAVETKQLVDFFNAMTRSIREGEPIDIEAMSMNLSAPIGEPTQIKSKASLGSPISFPKTSLPLSFVTDSDKIDIVKLINEIVDKKQKVWFWMADQLGRGYYSDEVIKGNHYLDAGPSFALDPKNRKKNVLWASGLTKKTLQSQIDKSDYIFFISGSPEKAKLFNKQVLLLIGKRITDTSSFDAFKKAINEFGKETNELKTMREALSKVNSFEELANSSVRKEFLIAIDKISKKKTSPKGSLKELLSSFNAFVDLNELRDGFYKENNFTVNDVMLVGKPTGVGGKADHSTYESEILGEVVGVPDRKINAWDLMPDSIKNNPKYAKIKGREEKTKSLQTKIIAAEIGVVRELGPLKAIEQYEKADAKDKLKLKSKAQVAVHKDTGFVPVGFWVEQLKGKTGYLDDVIKNIFDAREQLKEGKVTDKKVVKSYLITLASMGSGGGYLKGWTEKTGQKISDVFLEKVKGKDWIRPEGSAAAYLVTPDGEKLVDDIINGTATPEQIKKLFVYVGVGRENSKTEYVASTIKSGGIKAMTDLFNENRGKDFSKLYDGAIKNLKGIAQGKTGFFNQYFGVAERGVVDARELNAWIAGSMKLTEEQKAKKKKAASSKKIADQLLGYIEQVGIELGYPKDLAGYIAHHAIWDAIAKSVTTHQGEYMVVSKAQVASEVKQLEKLSVVSKAQVDAYHGSPYDFDEFTLSKIGTGEGAQAFGWGLYFTDIKSIAEGYANKLSASRAIKYKGKTKYELEGKHPMVKMFLLDLEQSNPKTKNDALNWLEKNKKGKSERVINELSELINDISIGDITKRVYQVSLHQGKTPDQYTWLEWDKKVPIEIVDRLKDKVKKNNYTLGDHIGTMSLSGALKSVTGKDFYEKISSLLGGDKEASLFLLKNGIDGVKYPAESIARGATSDTARGFNYVVFDDKAVTIVSKAQKKADAKKAMQKVVTDARSQGFSEGAIRMFLNRRGLSPSEVDEIMSIEGAGKKVEVTETFAEGYDRMMSEVDGIIEKGLNRGTDQEKILENVINYIQGSKVYENATDVQREQLIRDARAAFGKKEKAAPKVERILGTLKDVKNVTMSEYQLLKKQIKDYARGAKDATRAWRKASQELTKDLRELVRGGKITSKQAVAVLRRFSKVNMFDPNSIESFVNYMTKVFENADYAERISGLRKKLKLAKDSASRKIGIAEGLYPMLNRMLSIDPTLIPDSVLDTYAEIVEMLGKRDAVLPLQEIQDVTEKTKSVLDAVDNELSTLEMLSELFEQYPDKVVDANGVIQFADTLDEMVSDGTITNDEAKILRKYKNKVMPRAEKIKKTEQELKDEKDEMLRALASTDIDAERLPTQDERDVARELQKLKNTDAVNSLSNSELERLLGVIDNINNGYLPHHAQLMKERLISINNESKLESSVKKAKPLPVTQLYARLKKLFFKNSKALELMVQRNPLFYIDQVYGDFKTKDIFNAIFKDISDAMGVFKLSIQRVEDKLLKALDAVAKSHNNDPKKTKMSSYKMMAYMLQLEFQSNPDSVGVHPAAEFLKATIKHIREGKTTMSEIDADMLQEILDKYADSDGNIDAEKIFNSLNPAEKKALETIKGINADMRDKAVFTAHIIRGDKLTPLNNYVHHNVLHDFRPEENISGVTSAEEFNNMMQPSTRGKSLIARTKGVKPLDFNIFSATQRGANYVLMDYYLTEPIRTARKTLNATERALEGETGMSKKDRDTFNAIRNAFETDVRNTLMTRFHNNTFADEVVNFVTKNGYRAVLASTTRWVAELTSNMGFIMIADPKSWINGVKNYMDVVSSPNSIDILINLKSSQSARLYPSDTLSGRMIDSSTMNQASGIRGGKTNGAIANAMQRIYNNSLKKYQNFVETTADTLISTPDKIMMRPYWFGSFAAEFKKLTGKEPNFDLIAENNEAYMNEFKEALKKATSAADEKSVLAGASDNPFMGILKGQVTPDMPVLLKAFNIFNNYMTTFLMYEYSTARTGIMAAMGNGSISRKQGAALLGGVATRMVVYSLLTSTLSNELVGLFVDDEDEDDEKSLLQKVGQAMASGASALILGRDFGNATRSIINYGVERMNEEFLTGLRNGEYDPYKDAIAYSAFASQSDNSTLQDYAINMMGPLTPIAKTTALIVKKASGEPKKEEAAREREAKEIGVRIPLEILGNAGLVPLYKDIRKVVLAYMYKGMKKELGKTKKEFVPEFQSPFEMNKEDMERYYPEIYKDIYGKGSLNYELEEMERKMKSQLDDVERKMKDEMYNYTPKKKERKKKED